MAADVSAAELDYVQIDRKLVERAVEALDRAMKAGVKVVIRPNRVPVVLSRLC